MRKNSQILHYAVAVLAVALAVPLTYSLKPLELTPSTLFFAAVMVSAWYGGLLPGLLATALSALALDYFFMPEAYTLGVEIADAVRLTMFVLVAVLISYLNGARKRLEATLRLQDRRKDEFLAMLAHELRNFLAPVANALQVWRLGGAGNQVVNQSRDIVERQVQHMTRLINDLLDASRIHQGKVELCKRKIDLATAVRQVVEATQPLIDAHHHRHEVSLPADPVLVEADPTRLEQIVVNLLTNAIKYTEPGGLIQLSVEATPDEALLRVRDTGIGLSVDILPHVFELFVQADNRSRGGLGIGLNLVQSLVQLHGGTITAASEGPGKGSEFVVRFPLAASSINRTPSESTQEASALLSS
jgi:signal transduction histidine kinase